MDRWVGKVAVVTGASSGIGAAIVKDLVSAGMIVAGLARRKERVEQIRKDLPADVKGKLYAVKCDLTRDDDIVKAFAWISFELGSIDVLINNAGVARLGSITTEGNEDELKEVLQTNLWGLVLATKKAVEIMKRKKVIGGHVININSTLGHQIPTNADFATKMNVYPASKYAVTAFTEVLRQEFNFDNSNYKVTV